jgi:hypothetical protein
MMNSEVGFGRKVLSVLEEYGVSFEHMPTGIDSMCVVVNSSSLAPHREEILARLEKLVEGSGSVSVNDNMAIIATVGRGMVHNCGTAARLFSAMSRARINVRMIDQGSSELSIIVGVNEYTQEEEPPKGLLKVDASVGVEQCKKLADLKAGKPINKMTKGRDNAAVKAALDELEAACKDENENLMPHILKAVKTYATLGEICNVMRGVFGLYEAHVSL